MILKKFKIEGLYIVSTTDIVKELRYIQVLKIWGIMPDLCGIEKLVDRLDGLFTTYTDDFINLCRDKCFEGYALLHSSILNSCLKFILWNHIRFRCFVKIFNTKNANFCWFVL